MSFSLVQIVASFGTLPPAKSGVSCMFNQFDLGGSFLYTSSPCCGNSETSKTVWLTSTNRSIGFHDSVKLLARKFDRTRQSMRSSACIAMRHTDARYGPDMALLVLSDDGRRSST